MTVDQAIQQLEELKQSYAGSGDWELKKYYCGDFYSVVEIIRENTHLGNVAVIK